MAATVLESFAVTRPPHGVAPASAPRAAAVAYVPSPLGRCGLGLLPRFTGLRCASLSPSPRVKPAAAAPRSRGAVVCEAQKTAVQRNVAPSSHFIPQSSSAYWFLIYGLASYFRFLLVLHDNKFDELLILSFNQALSRHCITVPEVTKSTWQSLVLDSSVPVLIDFWAPWCGPCRMIEPTVVKLAKAYEGKLKCYKLNTDESPDIATQYGIRSIPTMMIFKNGEKKDAVIGAVPESTLVASIEKFV
ncbi:unnamed protein product [Musa acuminata var. zebrina]